MKQFVMALDAGTTSNRCILFDKQGNICSVENLYILWDLAQLPTWQTLWCFCFRIRQNG